MPATGTLHKAYDNNGLKDRPLRTQTISLHVIPVSMHRLGMTRRGR